MDMTQFHDCSESFARDLEGFSPPVELTGTTSIYCLSPDFRLAAYDDGWVSFARENGGDLRKLGLGVSVMDTVPVILRDFYRRVYSHCLETGDVWCHHYQCSSPSDFRVFEEIVIGMPERQGLVIAHQLQMQMPQPNAVEYPEEAKFVNPLTEAIGQCAHCRRVVDPHHRRWVLMPEWVRHRPGNIQDDLCPACYVSTYRNVGLTA